MRVRGSAQGTLSPTATIGPLALLQRAYFGQNRPPLSVKETFLFHSVRPLCAFFVVPPLAFPFLHAVHLENSVKEVKIVIALLIET